MAAEVARAAGVNVDLFDAKGSVGRKFLIAGKGGLNLTHSEPMPMFAKRYREREGEIAGWLRDFGADALREWARGLGVDTFVGTSRSEEHTSELQSLMRISYAVFCLKKKKTTEFSSTELTR